MAPQSDEERFRNLELKNIHNTIQGAKDHANRAQKSKIEGDEAKAKKCLDRSHQSLEQAAQHLARLREETLAKIEERKKRESQ